MPHCAIFAQIADCQLAANAAQRNEVTPSLCCLEETAEARTHTQTK